MYATSAEQRKRAQVKSLAAELYAEQYIQLLATARKHAATHAEGEEALQDAFTAFVAHFDPSRQIWSLYVSGSRVRWHRCSKSLSQGRG
jgi:hypothetical protein